jgi:type II secretory pathway pseudopilin PulG
MSAGSAGSAAGFAPLTRGEASGFCERGVLLSEKATPPLAFGSRPPYQGVEKTQRGFTYVGLLLSVAIAGAGLAAFAEVASHAGQREKEAELLFRGNAFQAAIGSYYKKEQRYPKSLENLLKDERYPMPVRHLRKLYVDPMTGTADWAVVEAPGGGVMGVHSRSEETPVKTGNFLLKNAEFAKAQRYSEWKFVHSPTGLSPRVEKSPPK